MAFTEEDKIAIKFLRENKNYGAKRILKEFPNKGWSLGSKISSVDELKNRIKQAWSELEQSIINAAVKKWRIRLKACVAAGGGYFEHQFK